MERYLRPLQSSTPARKRHTNVCSDGEEGQQPKRPKRRKYSKFIHHEAEVSSSSDEEEKRSSQESTASDLSFVSSDAEQDSPGFYRRQQREEVDPMMCISPSQQSRASSDAAFNVPNNAHSSAALINAHLGEDSLMCIGETNQDTMKHITPMIIISPVIHSSGDGNCMYDSVDTLFMYGDPNALKSKMVDHLKDNQDRYEMYPNLRERMLDNLTPGCWGTEVELHALDDMLGPIYTFHQIGPKVILIPASPNRVNSFEVFKRAKYLYLYANHYQPCQCQNIEQVWQSQTSLTHCQLSIKKEQDLTMCKLDSSQLTCSDTESDSPLPKTRKTDVAPPLRRNAKNGGGRKLNQHKDKPWLKVNTDLPPVTSHGERPCHMSTRPMLLKVPFTYKVGSCFYQALLALRPDITDTVKVMRGKVAVHIKTHKERYMDAHGEDLITERMRKVLGKNEYTENPEIQAIQEIYDISIFVLVADSLSDTCFLTNADPDNERDCEHPMALFVLLEDEHFSPVRLRNPECLKQQLSFPIIVGGGDDPICKPPRRGKISPPKTVSLPPSNSPTPKKQPSLSPSPTPELDIQRPMTPTKGDDTTTTDTDMDLPPKPELDMQRPMTPTKGETTVDATDTDMDPPPEQPNSLIQGDKKEYKHKGLAKAVYLLSKNIPYFFTGKKYLYRFPANVDSRGHDTSDVLFLITLGHTPPSKPLNAFLLEVVKLCNCRIVHRHCTPSRDLNLPAVVEEEAQTWTNNMGYTGELQEDSALIKLGLSLRSLVMYVPPPTKTDYFMNQKAEIAATEVSEYKAVLRYTSHASQLPLTPSNWIKLSENFLHWHKKEFERGFNTEGYTLKAVRGFVEKAMEPDNQVPIPLYKVDIDPKLGRMSTEEEILREKPE